MTLTKRLPFAIFISVTIGLVVGMAIMSEFSILNEPTDSDSSAEDKPMYWVAPMDDNYRRDKPGKSPMGMDLVPVYAQNTAGAGLDKGTIIIAPNVINNLGVRTETVSVASMQTFVSTVGYVQYDENKLVHIHPRVSGWIEKLYLKAAGDPVEKGQPIYTLYSPQLVNAQDEFLIALKRNNQSLITAAKQRLTALQLSTQFIEKLEKNRQVQQTVTFYAPQSGVVDALQIREGFYVEPGNTLMSIGQLDRVWVEAEVFERDSVDIKRGLAVTMNLEYLPGVQWLGVVDYIYPALNPKTRTLRVRISFENKDDLLKPNMFAQVTIQTASQHESILAPREAIIRTGSQDRAVLSLGEGKFKSVEVVVGRVNDQVIEILDGLKEGDLVVTSAQFLIDSESSKNSDFLRMSENQEALSAHAQNSNAVSSANVDGVINSIDFNSRTLNISRGPIEKWSRPAATMDFIAADNISLNSLSVGMKVNFTFDVDRRFTITELIVVAPEHQHNIPQE